MNDSELTERGHLAFAERARDGSRFDGGAIDEDEELVLYASGTSEFPVLVNGAIPTGSPDPVAALERARAFFAERERGYTLIVRDLPDHDREWEAAIEAAGFPLLLPRHPVMVCDATLPGRAFPEGVTLRQVIDEAGFEAFRSVQVAAFPAIGFPAEEVAKVLTPGYVLRDDAVAWVAWMDGEPVGAAMAILDDGIAGVVWVGTLERARGRGIAEACTRAVTNSGFERGAQAAWLEASVMGEPVYARMGYRHLFGYKLYVSGTPEAN